jgi:outer membrane lipopolysaccharide assembly protein LptE/RlpB
MKIILMRFVYILLACTLLSSCGFHLRGKIDTSVLQSIKGMPVYLSVTSEDKKLFRQLKRDFQLADYVVVSEPSLSRNHLVVLNSTFKKRAVGVDTLGRNNEFEIMIGIEFIVNQFDQSKQSKEQFKEQAELEQSIITAHRNLYRDSFDSIGKNAEENSLIDSMRQELSLKIMSQFTATIRELERVNKTQKQQESRFPK